MTNLENLVVTWRYWDVMTQAATPDEWAEFHDQFLAAERELKDAADQLTNNEEAQ